MKLQVPRKSILVTVVLFCLSTELAACQGEKESSKAVVREAVTAKVRVQDLSQAEPKQLADQWQPGDPVRVVEDLKSSDEADMSNTKDQPVVRQPVKPDSMNRSLDELPTAEHHPADDPVHVVEDMKEDCTDEKDTKDKSEQDPPGEQEN